MKNKNELLKQMNEYLKLKVKDLEIDIQHYIKQNTKLKTKIKELENEIKHNKNITKNIIIKIKEIRKSEREE